ncbi:glycosyltransferase family 2 protein [Flavobacterium sp. AS60]|uniref:glycosyltransferase family 2 protein n=1 Tax=Flavobacterium anseongense TaxID=2910677 RepID=UPI001F32EB93|nr:glycosyltransferase family 2 protein [Flavobacterium sp. AS60]MCF6128966.1 glycosyltransferase family 2 protein [Flavobacterium sp. AS60]
MQLSVIILNYNVRYFLELCVLSTQKAIQNLDAEIIVIDNNSSDDSCEMMKQRFPSIRLIENKENSGFPKGNNIAVKEAKGEYICILNPDTVVAEDTFEKVLAFAKSQNDLGIVGCKLIDGTGNFLPESKRGIPTPWVAFTKIFGLYKLFPKSTLFNKYYAQHFGENQTGKVDILVGAFMVMKRELYNQLEGFDENCFMYADDIDLSYRALLLQKQNYYFHETTVIHYKGESTVKDATYMKHFREFMNFFYKKHFKQSLFFNLMARFGAFYFSMVKLFQGKSKATIPPSHYVLVSDNETTREKLENKLQKKVDRTTSESGKIVFSQSISEKKNTQVILDTNYLNFKDAITFFETSKNKSVTFKLLPMQSNFIIGSNSSNDRGEVIVFSEQSQ